MARVGIIGGTGVYDPSWLVNPKEQIIETPYGKAQIIEGPLRSRPGQSVVFMNRHGAGHSVPPHQVNYRANIWALKSLGVKRVIATAAVGSLNLAMPAGSMVLVDQFLDFTKSRPDTFFDGSDGRVVHTDMSSPYCRATRSRVQAAGARAGVSLVMGGVYVTTEGPRFETAAEIRAYRLLGGDVVGMTSVPEVVLARELGICYATVAMVTNFAAGISQTALTHQEVLEVMGSNAHRLREVLLEVLPDVGEEFACECPAGEPPVRS